MTVGSVICQIEQTQEIIDKFQCSLVENIENGWDENGCTDKEYYDFIVNKHGLNYRDANRIVNILKEEIERLKNLELKE